MWLLLLVILIAILAFYDNDEFVHKNSKREQIWTR